MRHGGSVPPVDFVILTLALWALHQHGKNGAKSQMCPHPPFSGSLLPLLSTGESHFFVDRLKNAEYYLWAMV